MFYLKMLGLNMLIHVNILGWGFQWARHLRWYVGLSMFLNELSFRIHSEDPIQWHSHLLIWIHILHREWSVSAKVHYPHVTRISGSSCHLQLPGFQKQHRKALCLDRKGSWCRSDTQFWTFLAFSQWPPWNTKE